MGITKFMRKRTKALERETQIILNILGRSQQQHKRDACLNASQFILVVTFNTSHTINILNGHSQAVEAGCSQGSFPWRWECWCVGPDVGSFQSAPWTGPPQTARQVTCHHARSSGWAWGRTPRGWNAPAAQGSPGWELPGYSCWCMTQIDTLGRYYTILYTLGIIVKSCWITIDFSILHSYS